MKAYQQFELKDEAVVEHVSGGKLNPRGTDSILAEGIRGLEEKGYTVWLARRAHMLCNLPYGIGVGLKDEETDCIPDFRNCMGEVSKLYAAGRKYVLHHK